MDAYRHLAPMYAQVWGRPHTIEVTASRLVGAGAKSLIEFGCGPGLLLHGLRARLPEVRLEGVDLSSAMIREARRPVSAISLGTTIETISGMSLTGPRFMPSPFLVEQPLAEKKTGAPTLPIRWTVGDIRKGVPRKYDAAAAFGQVLDHLMTFEDLTSAIDGVKRSLNEDGLFIFDLSTMNKNVARVWGSSGHNWAIAGITRVARQRYVHQWRIARQGRIIAGSSQNRIWSRMTVGRVLSRAGFVIEDVQPWIVGPILTTRLRKSPRGAHP